MNHQPSATNLGKTCVSARDRLGASVRIRAFSNSVPPQRRSRIRLNSGLWGRKSGAIRRAKSGNALAQIGGLRDAVPGALPCESPKSHHSPGTSSAPLTTSWPRAIVPRRPLHPQFRVASATVPDRPLAGGPAGSWTGSMAYAVMQIQHRNPHRTTNHSLAHRGTSRPTMCIDT